VFGPLFPQSSWALLNVWNSLWDLNKTTRGNQDVLGSCARPLIPQCGSSLQTLRYPHHVWKFSLQSEQKLREATLMFRACLQNTEIFTACLEVLSLGPQQNNDKQILCSGLGSQVL
jgi:hypothetical protein